MYYERSRPTITIGFSHSLVPNAHLHNEIELIYCRKGSFNAYIDSKEYTVNEGQLSLSFPNQSHFYLYNKEEELDVCILIFSVKVLPEIEKMLDTSLPINPVVQCDDRELTEHILNKMYENKSRDDYSVLKRSGYLKLLAASIFENMEFLPSQKADPNTLSAIVDYCNKNFSSDIHLSDLEEHLHINKYYISHIFKDKVKMGFNEYIHFLRIEAAQKMLKETDDTITTIAYNVGYNSVRNFNRSFLKHTGKTPGKFRELKTKSKQ